jgi:hypothetical protein
VDGKLIKSGGGFCIDDPRDPKNRYLSHSFVESSDMKNLYDGIAALDANGEATVAIPPWLEALNTDFRYQLTPVGAPAPALHVAQELVNGTFKIAGGAPGLKVSWQLTGIRQDAWARANMEPVESTKPEGERGSYVHPELHQASQADGLESRLYPGATSWAARQAELAQGDLEPSRPQSVDE